MQNLEAQLCIYTVPRLFLAKRPSISRDTYLVRVSRVAQSV